MLTDGERKMRKKNARDWGRDISRSHNTKGTMRSQLLEISNVINLSTVDILQSTKIILNVETKTWKLWLETS